jgi:hypothetical protein
MRGWIDGWMDRWMDGWENGCGWMTVGRSMDIIWHNLLLTYRCDLHLMLMGSCITKIVYPYSPLRIFTAIESAARTLIGFSMERIGVLLKKLGAISHIGLLAHRAEVNRRSSTCLVIVSLVLGASCPVLIPTTDCDDIF